MLEIPVFRGGREQSSLDRRPLSSYRGQMIANVHQAPSLLVHRTVAELAKAAPDADEDPALRWAAIARAGALLEAGHPAVGSLDEAAGQVTLATGAPLRDAARALHDLAAALSHIEEALAWQAPGGDLNIFQSRRVAHPDGKGYAWVPVGKVLGFVAPSNHPGVHLTWVMALAMGWSVVVRPGADDPITPYLLVRALAAAGFPVDRVALLPGGHELVPALTAACDRSVAYGGPALAALLGQDGRVLFNGPGYSKVLVDGPTDAAKAADFLLECVLHDGGRKCTCASGIVVRGEAPGVLDGLEQRLAAVPLLDPLDPAARVPAWKESAAVLSSGAQLTMLDGVAFARPGLVRCADSRPPFGREIPAPFVTALELPTGADPMAVLHGSLAVTLLSADRPLREACLLDPTIRKVFTGPIPPWHTEPGAPHQGRLSDFLHTCKFSPEVALWT